MHQPSLKRVLANTAAVGLFWVSACDTAAVGVEACRQVEYARCSAASHCPSTFHITSPAACRRFYRDHCLHGLAVSTDPGSPAVNLCTRQINLLGACAAPDSESAQLSSCKDVHSLDSKVSTVCALLQEPENIKGCEFLNPSPPAQVLDAGQDAGI